MMRALTRSTNGHNPAYFVLRWVLLVGFSAMIFIAQGRTLSGFESVQDIVLAFAIGAVATVLMGLMMLVPTLRVYLPYLIMPGDWLVAGAFVRVAGDNLLLVTAIAGLLLVTSMLRLGSGWGVTNAIGIIIAALIGLGLSPDVGFDLLLAEPLTYLPVLLALVLLTVVTAVWAHVLDDHNSRRSREIRETVSDQARRLNDMHERMRLVAELGGRLNGTLDYGRVLDATLEIGRLSLRKNLKQRVVSLCLLVEDDETLYIASSRGLNHIDQQRKFRGKRGVLREAIDIGIPIISDDGETDPELGTLNAFKNIYSVLTIPLRAGYDSFGVLVYGSSEANAFTEDHIDTLAALGSQATVSLQNAVLYAAVREEKERILLIEDSARKELVRDLHDVPTQTISAVAMRLGVIPVMFKKAPGEVEEEINTIRDMALRATAELRHVMFTLRPLSLETQGLKVALEQLAEKTIKTHNQNVVLELEERAVKSLEEKQEGSLFFLIEEAVNNARKYAEASEIRVSVRLYQQSVIVRVRDNGKGFEVSKVTDNYDSRGSFGMVNMRERAELINARFEIDSTRGAGTTVTVIVPVTTLAPEPARDGRSDTASKRKTLGRRPREYGGPLSPSR